MRLGYSGKHFRYWRKGICLQTVPSKDQFLNLSESQIASIAVHNLTVLQKILEFNVENDLLVYEIAPDVLPWYHTNTHIEYAQIDCVASQLQDIGAYIEAHGIRVSMMPPLWNSILSTKESSMVGAITAIERTSQLFDMIGLPASSQAPIGISLHTNVKSLQEKYNSLRDRINTLTLNAKSRLAIRNDGKETRHSVYHLTEDLQNIVQIPVLVDTLLHSLHPAGLTSAEAIAAASKTWGAETPLVHYSEPKLKFEWVNKKNKHQPSNSTRSYLVYEKPNIFDGHIDLIIKAEGHEKAAIHMRNKHWRRND